MGDTRKSKYHEYLTELLESLENPLHKRIVQALEDSDPIKSMEEELGLALTEILENED